ncbi:hypothetical protein N7454_010041 [Penicillium verhagenii]|nr:hypothetical protein N7454_010041 [Penicillium verhagenii]
MQRRQLLSSPLKRSNTTPNFRSKASQVLDEDEDEVEEDEETLELRLAEIQARLKLKQLQKSRGRSGTLTSYTEEDDDSFGSGPHSQRQIMAPPRSPPPSQRKARTDEIQVPVSPTRRPAPAPEPWSPRRYQLGIDKGRKASDVSLKRPPVPRMEPRPASQLGTRSGAMSRSSDMIPARPQTFPGGGGINRIKSFSERMAEGRAAERAEQTRLEKAERVHANRSSAFQVDKTEIETFKATAAKEPQSTLPLSMNRDPEEYAFNRAEILRSLSRPGGLKRSQTTPNMNEGSDAQHNNSDVTKRTPDASKFESYSKLNLSSRILPHSFLTRTLTDKTVLRIPDLLKTIKGPAFELPETIDGDFVVVGIVASKSEPRQTKSADGSTNKKADPYDDGLNNTNRYMVITLTDLKWTIDLFLFDTAFPRYYKITEGTLVAILNPIILPPPKHRLDTNRFSLALSSSDDKVLEIGKAQDIGYCKSTKKDGKNCGTWIDGRKTEFCDFHTDLQVRRTQSVRAGLNTGAGQLSMDSRTGVYERRKWTNGRQAMPTPKKEGLPQKGGQYDWASGSTYFVAPGPRNRGNGRAPYNPMTDGRGAAALDRDDDPFIAAGMMGRGAENKEEQVRRRLAAQQRERDITTKLISGRTGGLGAEYLRTRTDQPPSTTQNDSKPPNTQQPPPSSTDFNVSSFGRAKNVKLGPMKRAHDGDKPHGSGVKKTRFITSRGIREAGRDSLGGPEATGGQLQALSDDDDDELEFV